MLFEFEMMMFDILQAVTHFRLAAAKGFRPECARAALNLHSNLDRFEFGVDHQFGSQCAGSKL